MDQGPDDLTPADRLEELRRQRDALTREIDALVDELLLEARMPEVLVYLRRLWKQAAGKSSRALSQEMGSISHATVANALNGTNVPSWKLTLALGLHLGGDEGTLHRLWVRHLATTQ